jgi:hypothetical protein
MIVENRDIFRKHRPHKAPHKSSRPQHVVPAPAMRITPVDSQGDTDDDGPYIWISVRRCWCWADGRAAHANAQSIRKYLKMSALLRQPPSKGQQVTLVISDIEGSTSLWDAMPQQMNDALATHDTLLRSLMRTHHGYDIPRIAVGLALALSIEFELNNSGVRVSTWETGAQ